MRIGPREWCKAASELRVDADALRDRLQALAHHIPAEAPQVQRDLKAQGIKHPLIASLVKALTERATATAALPW